MTLVADVDTDIDMINDESQTGFNTRSSIIHDTTLRLLSAREHLNNFY